METNEKELQFRFNNKHGEHVVTKIVEIKEIKRFGVAEVVKYHAGKMGLTNYKAHVFGLQDEDDYEVINTSNEIRNRIPMDKIYNIYDKILSRKSGN